MTDHVLVSGGAGYIGSHACKVLRAAGYVPVTYDNLGTGKEFSVCDVVEASRLVTNREAPYCEGPRHAGHATKLVSGSTRATAELGCSPERSTMAQMIADAPLWHRNGHHDG